MNYWKKNSEESQCWWRVWNSPRVRWGILETKRKQETWLYQRACCCWQLISGWVWVPHGTQSSVVTDLFAEGQKDKDELMRHLYNTSHTFCLIINYGSITIHQNHHNLFFRHRTVRNRSRFSIIIIIKKKWS